jgi:hypothetical protein
MKIVIYSILGFFGLVIVLGFLETATSIVSAPGRVIQETLKTNNIINNYEMFFDLNAGYERRVADIQSQKLMLDGATGDELNRLKIELVGLQQTCRDLVTRYNAASEKENRSLFKANKLPEQLEITTCN